MSVSPVGISAAAKSSRATAVTLAKRSAAGISRQSADRRRVADGALTAG
jgi:hypothetical protein